MKIKNYKFETVENFNYLGAILNEANNNQIDLQERIKNTNKIYFMLQTFFKNRNIKETKIKTKQHNNRQNIICIRNLDTNKERQKATEHYLKESV